MADKTGIEWADATWNPVTGCTKVSQGCKHCYAERGWARLVHMPAFAGRAFTDVACHPERLDQPRRWTKPRRIFVNSMSDLFHEDIPGAFIRAVFAVMAEAQQHTFQILTKRPGRMQYLLSKWASDGLVLRSGFGVRLPNVWLGVSVEDQETADDRIPLLLNTPAMWRWISAEPLLGPVDLTGEYLAARCGGTYPFPSLPDEHRTKIIDLLDWLVVGGESGPKARPMHPDWVRSLRDQCAAAGVPFLFKQWGEWLPGAPQYPFTDEEQDQFDGLDFGLEIIQLEMDGCIADGCQPRPGSWLMARIGKRAAGRHLDGVIHDEYPEAS